MRCGRCPVPRVGTGHLPRLSRDEAAFSTFRCIREGWTETLDRLAETLAEFAVTLGGAGGPTR